MFTIKNHLRLGDLVRNIPIFQAYADKHGEVRVIADSVYHGLFEMLPATITCVAPSHGDQFDLDLDIWPGLYRDYTVGMYSLTDFIYRLAGTPKGKPELHNRLDPIPHELLISPFGITQSDAHEPIEMIEIAKRVGFPGEPTILRPPWVDPSVVKGYQTVCATSIPELVALIEGAGNLLTSNSSPSVIAHAVRESYHAVYSQTHQGKDHYHAPNQITLYL